VDAEEAVEDLLIEEIKKYEVQRFDADIIAKYIILQAELSLGIFF
jgi:hypothetical protein